jgi:hypothetical protein
MERLRFLDSPATGTTSEQYTLPSVILCWSLVLVKLEREYRYSSEHVSAPSSAVGKEGKIDNRACSSTKAIKGARVVFEYMLSLLVYVLEEPRVHEPAFAKMHESFEGG